MGRLSSDGYIGSLHMSMLASDRRAFIGWVDLAHFGKTELLRATAKWVQ